MKKIFSIFALAVMLVACFTITSCEKNDVEEQHIHLLRKIDGKEPTCLQSGYKDTWICNCGKLFGDISAITEISSAEVIPATGHTYSDKLSYDQSGHWYNATCEHREERIGFETHTYGERVTSDKGYDSYFCEKCDYERKVGLVKVTYSRTEKQSEYLRIGDELPTDIVKDNYTLKGWTTDSNLYVSDTTPIYSVLSIEMLNSDDTANIYPVWVAIDYDITYYAKLNDTEPYETQPDVENRNPKTYNVEDSVLPFMAPEIDGYTLSVQPITFKRADGGAVYTLDGTDYYEITDLGSAGNIKLKPVSPIEYKWVGNDIAVIFNYDKNETEISLLGTQNSISVGYSDTLADISEKFDFEFVSGREYFTVVDGEKICVLTSGDGSYAVSDEFSNNDKLFDADNKWIYCNDGNNSLTFFAQDEELSVNHGKAKSVSTNSVWFTFDITEIKDYNLLLGGVETSQIEKVNVYKDGAISATLSDVKPNESEYYSSNYPYLINLNGLEKGIYCVEVKASSLQSGATIMIQDARWTSAEYLTVGALYKSDFENGKTYYFMTKFAKDRNFEFTCEKGFCTLKSVTDIDGNAVSINENVFSISNENQYLIGIECNADENSGEMLISDTDIGRIDTAIYLSLTSLTDYNLSDTNLSKVTFRYMRLATQKDDTYNVRIISMSESQIARVTFHRMSDMAKIEGQITVDGEDLVCELPQDVDNFYIVIETTGITFRQEGSCRVKVEIAE